MRTTTFIAMLLLAATTALTWLGRWSRSHYPRPPLPEWARTQAARVAAAHQGAG
jgi:hypothetical protein